MSAGAFVISKYEASSDSGSGVYPIRIQPETLALSIATVDNDPPAGAVNQRVSARVSGGRRQIGMNAALVRIKFTGTPPTGYLANGTLTLPLLTPEIRSVAAYGATGTYLGVAIQVIGTTSEKVR